MDIPEDFGDVMHALNTRVLLDVIKVCPRRPDGKIDLDVYSSLVMTLGASLIGTAKGIGCPAEDIALEMGQMTERETAEKVRAMGYRED